MRSILIAFVALLAAVDVHAQSEPGHVYVTYMFKAHPESETAYSQAYWEVLRPIWSRVRTQGGIVSYLDLSKVAGATGNDTHMVFVEFPDMQAFGNFAQELDRASQAVFGRPYAEVAAERFAPVRDPYRTDVYTTPPGGM